MHTRGIDGNASVVSHAGALHPAVPEALRRRMATFLADLHHAANVARTFGSAGGPWEFNLRDLLRWCQLAEGAVPAAGIFTLEGASQVTLMPSLWQYDIISNSLNRRSRFTCAPPHGLLHPCDASLLHCACKSVATSDCGDDRPLLAHATLLPAPPEQASWRRDTLVQLTLQHSAQRWTKITSCHVPRHSGCL